LDSNAIPFHTSSAKKLTLNQTPVITVTGKAFFDVGHSLKDQKFKASSLQWAGCQEGAFSEKDWNGFWLLAARASSRTSNAEKIFRPSGRCLPGRPNGTSAHVERRNHWVKM
jgi:hypothetical protein